MQRRPFRMKLACAAWVLSTSLVVTQAHADAMRCGRELVPDDTPLLVVRERCGPPTRETSRVEHRVWSVVGKHGVVSTYQQDVVVTKLLYDFGPNEFVYNLTFEDEKMIKMTRGDWGASR